MEVPAPDEVIDKIFTRGPIVATGAHDRLLGNDVDAEHVPSVDGRIRRR